MGLTSRIAVALLAAFIGCTPADAPRTRDLNDLNRESAKQAGDSIRDEEAAGTRGVMLRVIDEDELAEAIAGHRGKVVLVDFWATWCLACTELFPHTVALHNRFADDGLVVLSVSFDDPESQPAVLGFLEKHGATFDNFISRYGAGVESAERFGLPGGLPQVILFDRQGERAAAFPEPQSPVSPAAIDRAVEELLGGNP